MKAVAFFKRQASMSVEAFQRHWPDVHGLFGAAIPTLRRDVQNPTRLTAYDRGREPA